jgi:hypothetical protein
MFREIFITSLICLCYANIRSKRDWGDPLQDLGAPNYTCGLDKNGGSLMAPSRVKPTSVHALRPADINVVMALGDSITAANGAGAVDALQILLQYRGLAFLAGGDKGLDEHVTIPNILLKYNPHLFGQSYGIGSADVYDVAYLNIAQPGAVASDIIGQAQILVERVLSHPDVDLENDWKLLNIFIGGNDVCGYCRHGQPTPSQFANNIATAVEIVKASIPRVLVSLTTMLHLEMVRSVDKGVTFCEALHVDECGCESDFNFTDSMMSQLCTQYQIQEKVLEDNGTFEEEDFTLVTQPFFNDVTTPPMLNGSVNLYFFCPDCFHFSQLGHAGVATYLWKNMLEPVNNKTTKGELSTPALPLSCPDPECPFIRTTKNSINCSMYWSDAAW